MLSLVARLLGRLSVGRKLILIFLLDMSTVAFVSGILVDEKYIAIDFARKELAGSAYIAQLQGALIDGAAAASAHRPLPAAELHAVTHAEQRFGTAFGTAEPSGALARALQAMEAARGGPAEARAVLQAGRTLVTRVGNQSNLILDPDLDSYYTMSITVLRMPELLEAIAAVGHHLARGRPAAPDARTRFLLLEGRLDTSEQALASDYAEAYAAGGPALRAALTASHGELFAAIDEFRNAACAADEGETDAVRGRLEAAQFALLAKSGIAWNRTRAELERLLQARIDGMFTRMALHLGMALALLGLILSAVFFVATQIARPLRRLAAVADAVRRSGDHTLRAHWDSRDEIGRLVLAFNDMLAQLDRERAAQQELAASARAAEAQRQLVEAIPIPLMVTAIPGHEVLHANGPARAWLGPGDGDPWRQGIAPAVRARFFQQLADRDAVDEFEVRWAGNGDPSWAVLSARRLRFRGHDAVLTAFTPVNHLKLMERRLELWAKVFEASGEGILIIDTDLHLLTANTAFCRATGYELQDLVGEPVRPRAGHASPVAFLEALAPVFERGTHWQGEVTVHRRNGGNYPAWLMLSVVRDGQQGQVSHYIATTIDISDRKRNEERIRFLAQHDVLTELPNRSLCRDRLKQALRQAQRRGDKVAVLFIDLDRFKNINDSLGHHIGDGLLRSVSQRLAGSVRAGDTVARLGGDEFVVVLASVAGAHEAAAIVDDRLAPAVRAAHDIDGAELHVSCSVGIAMYPDDATDADTLMRHADAAMYQAKAQGRDAAHFFSRELNERAQRRLKIESNLRHAVDRGEFELHYQPRVDTRSGATVGAEALLRWHCAELGSVPVPQFIAVAEETGLIVPIGDWVIETACAQFAAWRREGVALRQVSINVSALQLRDDGLVQTLRAALERHALPPDSVEVELTESTLMDRAEQTLARLHSIKRLGVQLAVDDFGTGYSSLAYLNRYPIDRLKIDRSFVRDMFDDPTALAITRAIIGLGHTLGLKVVAEGVESEREAQTLREAGCDELQGYLLCRPLAADALRAWLQQQGAPRLRLAAG